MLHREKYISLVLTTLFSVSFIMGMEMSSSPVLQVPIQQLKQPMVHGPAQSLAYLCCKKIASEWAQIKELNQEQFAYIQSLNTSLSHEVRDLFAQEIVKCTHPKKLCIVPRHGKFSPDGSKLLINGSKNGNGSFIEENGIHVYNAVTGEKLFTLDAGGRSFRAYEWSPGGTCIFTERSGEDKTRFNGYIWRAKDGQLLWQIFNGCSGEVKFAPNDTFIIVKQASQPSYIINTQTGIIETDPYKQKLHTISIPAQDPLGQWVILLGSGELIAKQGFISIIRDANDYEKKRIVEGKITCFSPDGSLLASFTEDTCDLYNRSFELLYRFPRKSDDEYCCAIDINKATLVNFGWRLERLYSLKDYKLLAEYQHSKNGKGDRVFSSYDFSKKIILWACRLFELKASVYEGNTKLCEQLLDKNCPSIFNRISYTSHKHIVVIKHSSRNNYLMDIVTGQILPICGKSSVFRRSMNQSVSSDGKFLVKVNEPSPEQRSDAATKNNALIQVCQLQSNANGKWQFPINVDPEKAKTMPLEEVMKLVLAYNKKTED